MRHPDPANCTHGEASLQDVDCCPECCDGSCEEIEDREARLIDAAYEQAREREL